MAVALVAAVAGAETAPGVIHDGDVVVNAFERIGWTWGGRWPEPDYQHFAAVASSAG